MSAERQRRIEQQTVWKTDSKTSTGAGCGWKGGAIRVDDPKDHAIRNVFKSMHRDMDDTALFRSLPYRLQGHL